MASVEFIASGRVIVVALDINSAGTFGSILSATLESVRSVTCYHVTLLTLALGCPREKRIMKLKCLAQPKGKLSSWPSVYAWTLQTLGPIRFLFQLQAWLMSQFIVYADAAHVLLEIRRDTRELARSFLEFPLIHANNLHT